MKKILVVLCIALCVPAALTAEKNNEKVTVSVSEDGVVIKEDGKDVLNISASGKTIVVNDSTFSLNLEQLAKIEKARIATEATAKVSENVSHVFTEFGVPTMVFLSFVAIIFIIFFFRDRKRKYELLKKAIEHGQKIEDLNLNILHKAEEISPIKGITNGIIFLSIGLGFGICTLLLRGSFMNFPMLFITCFFLAFGAGTLVAGIVKNKMKKKE
ncbi:MAG: DUF6249 domain-containing protein [Bacteroidales bacterium]|jgi:hypothetical protein|nr:DUF6249 domain-containing protein [Bacteroidales bacterium]